MSKDTLQDFALKHKCSMLDSDRLIRELIGELEEIKDRLKKLEGESDKTVDGTNTAEPFIKDEKIRKAVRRRLERGLRLATLRDAPTTEMANSLHAGMELR